MGKRLGIIAGSGGIPLFIFQEASKLGYSCTVAGIQGDAEAVLPESIGSFQWFDIGEILDVVSYFRQNDIHEVIFAGKIDHRRIYSNQDMDNSLIDLIGQIEDKSPTSLITLAIEYLSMRGLTVIDPTPFLSSALYEEGVFSKTKPSQSIQDDIDFGWQKTRILADSDIGQTLVVKDKAVVTVEGMEGTDETIRRAGLLAGPGCVVIKTSRPHQDPRVDFPAVGPSTVECLIDARCSALCFEACRVALFQKEKALSLADAHSIAVLARRVPPD